MARKIGSEFRARYFRVALSTHVDLSGFAARNVPRRKNAPRHTAHHPPSFFY